MTHQTALFAILLGLTACVSRKPGPVTVENPAEVGIVIESNFTATVVIFLEAKGTVRRLGEVHTQETLSWVLPYRQLGGGVSRLRAEVIGSDQWIATPDLQVQPGQVVRWSLAPRLVQSAVTQF
jgi:hypothetical protein